MNAMFQCAGSANCCSKNPRCAGVNSTAPVTSPCVAWRCFQLPYNIGHESLLAVRTIFTRDDDSFTHLRMTTQDRFDLTQLNTETTHFHLMVHTTEELEIPIRHVTNQIARAIETGARLS